MKASMTLRLRHRVDGCYLAAVRQRTWQGVRRSRHNVYQDTSDGQQPLQPVVNSYKNLVSDNQNNQQNIVSNKMLR